MSQPRRPEVIAHRGFSARAPENTVAALQAALDAGVDSVEVDIQPAACGTPVLFHDPMLGRTTNGVGPLGRRSLAQLKALDAGGWFGPEFEGETIPTQAEALAVLKGRIGRLYLDIKGYRELEDLDRMVTVTREHSMGSLAVLTSADWVVMNHFRRTAPDVQRAYLVENEDTLSEALDRAAVDEGSLLSGNVEMLLAHSEVVREALETGVEVLAWTVNEEQTAARAMGAGITRIFTDEVERILTWRAGLFV